HAARLGSNSAEFLNLAIAPDRLDITGSQDGDEQSRLGQLLDDFVGEDVVPGELEISPDLGTTAHPHAQDGLQRSVKPADPPLLLRGQGPVVNMGITDEQVFFKAPGIHNSCLLNILPYAAATRLKNVP